MDDGKAVAAKQNLPTDGPTQDLRLFKCNINAVKCLQTLETVNVVQTMTTDCAVTRYVAEPAPWWKDRASIKFEDGGRQEGDGSVELIVVAITRNGL